MAKNRILIDKFTHNPQARTFHVTKRLTAHGLSDTLAKRFKFYPHKMIDALGWIEGVEGASIGTFDVRVTIGPAFDWDDITPQVVDCIKEVLGWPDAEVVDNFGV